MPERMNLWSDEQWRSWVDHLPVALALWFSPDPDPKNMVLVFANHKADELSGGLFRKNVGGTLGALFPETLTQPAETSAALALLRAARDGESSHFEALYEGGENHKGRGWFAQKYFPASPGYGGCLYEDITEKVELNEALESAVKELEHSNKALEQFAYVASHDLRAPLRAIEKLAGWLEEDSGSLLPPESLDYLHRIQHRSQRMKALLDGLLLYSRAGRWKEDSRKIELRPFLAELRRDLGIDEAQVQLHLELDALETYETPLYQVLSNLLDNAYKHHHDRDRCLVEIGLVDRGERVEFSVKDNGPGISERFHERIFEMFQTLRPADEVEGSGLGLALAKKIVEHMGCTLQLESAPGEGSTFAFQWPKGGML